jgi:hypothetical protein
VITVGYCVLGERGRALMEYLSPKISSCVQRWYMYPKKEGEEDEEETINVQ